MQTNQSPARVLDSASCKTLRVGQAVFILKQRFFTLSVTRFSWMPGPQVALTGKHKHVFSAGTRECPQVMCTQSAAPRRAVHMLEATWELPKPAHTGQDDEESFLLLASFVQIPLDLSIL